MKTAAVIGAGFGGLALAIRLQSAGIATTLVEARDAARRTCRGARAGRLHLRRHARRSSPIPMRLAELWRLSGRDIGEDVELLPVIALLPADVARRHQPRLFERRRRDGAPDRRAQSRGRRRLSPLPRLCRRGLSRGLSDARPGRLPRSQVDGAGGAAADQEPGVALGPCDRVVLRRGRASPPGAELPDAAARRQPDDGERHLRADPQARARGRHLVSARRHAGAGPTAWSRISSGWAARCGSAIRWWRSTRWATA